MSCRRDFILPLSGDAYLNVPWPQPRQASDSGQTYNASYTFICPECALIWCRSPCYNSPTPRWEAMPTWCIRERTCAACMPRYVERQIYMNPYTAWAPTHCPGTVLSICRHESQDVPSTLLWTELLAALPPALRLSELRCWAALDLLLNPLQPAAEEPPNGSSDPLVQFADNSFRSSGLQGPPIGGTRIR